MRNETSNRKYINDTAKMQHIRLEIPTKRSVCFYSYPIGVRNISYFIKNFPLMHGTELQLSHNKTAQHAAAAVHQYSV